MSTTTLRGNHKPTGPEYIVPTKHDWVVCRTIQLHPCAWLKASASDYAKTKGTEKAAGYVKQKDQEITLCHGARRALPTKSHSSKSSPQRKPTAQSTQRRKNDSMSSLVACAYAPDLSSSTYRPTR